MCARLLFEAIVVGVLGVLAGFVVGPVVGYFLRVPIPETCKKWNKNHVMEVSLFFIGFTVHLLCELFKLNSWYCRNGNACR